MATATKAITDENILANLQTLMQMTSEGLNALMVAVVDWVEKVGKLKHINIKFPS